MESARRSEALREEMELHLAEKAAELQADGMTPECARAKARRRFGNVGLKHEESREIWIKRFWSELGQDVRYGCRTMTANKAFSALAVLSLALGIGANTTIYSFMESILLRSLPVADPESLVVLNWHSRPPQNASKEWVHVMHGVQGMAWPGDKGAMVSGMFPYGAFETLREENPVFSTLFGYFNGLSRNLAIRGQAMSASAEYVTGEYFRGLAVSPAAGRLIDSEDDRPGAAPVAVISFATSQNRFGGSPNAIGQSILVDNIPFTVIGVAPPEFFGVDPAVAPDLYLPLHTNVLVDGAGAARMYGDGNFYWIEMMGRLRPGVSMAQAQAALAPRFHQWVAATATTDGERAKLPALMLNPGAAGLGSLRRQYSKPLYVLLTMVGLILAITCANIANLLLARAAARRREMAVRLSLGAGRFRVVRQLLTESVMLASLGGALGVLFAIWGMRSLTFLFSHGQENFTLHAELNWNVLGVTAALSVVCGLLFGLAPAIQSTRPDVMPALKNGREGGAAPPRTARAGGRPNRDLFSHPGRRRSVCPDTQQTALRPTGIRPREHPSVLVECAPGRASRPGDRHFLHGPAQALRIDPRREQRDAFAILDHQRRPRRAGNQGANEDRRCYHRRRARSGRRTAFPHDDADSDPGRA
jgi:predicted permease